MSRDLQDQLIADVQAALKRHGKRIDKTASWEDYANAGFELVAELKAVVAADASREAFYEDAGDWIACFGSDRLRMAWDQGIECDAIYRDERLELEHPKWGYLAEPALNEPRNPPTEALELLEEAQQDVSNAQLRYAKAHRTYVVVANYLDRLIAYDEEV